MTAPERARQILPVSVGAAVAVRLFMVCAAFQVVDGLQAIAAGSLRGLKDTRVPMMLAAIGYWVIPHLGWRYMFAIAGIGALVVYDGESTWEEGTILIGLYIVIAASFWWGA